MPGRLATAPLIRLTQHTVAVGAPQPRTLVDRLCLTLRSGERWAILGPNGAGKSTTAQLLGRCLAASPTAGELTSSAGIASAAAAGKDRLATFISFESHRRLLRDEATEFSESRFSVVHLRATVASYLFPALYPVHATDEALTSGGYRPDRTRVTPLPVPYDACASHPLLAELEAAATSGEAGRLLAQFGLRAKRHRPVHARSQFIKSRHDPPNFR